MRKLHQNLFYYYTGSSRPGKDVDQQIENNTTKAFINMLENSSLETQRAVLRKIGINARKSEKRFKYCLQTSDIGFNKYRKRIQRYLLAISRNGKEPIRRGGCGKKDSIPDAWIWSSSTVVLIENKTWTPLLSDQLSRHKRLLGGKCKFLFRSWRDHVYPAIKEVRRRELNEKDSFLLSEFLRYLEVINMSRFEGFDKQDFMRIYDDDEEEFNYLREKFETLALEVKKKLKDKAIELFNSKASFNRKNIGWHGFFQPKLCPYPGLKCYQVAHFSIFFKDGVGFKLHVPDFHLKRLRNKIKNDNKRKQFKKLLNKLNYSRDRGYALVIADLLPAKKNVRYHRDWASEYRIWTPAIKSNRLDNALNMIVDGTADWFNIYYLLDPSEAEKHGGKIVSDIAQVVNEWWPIYKFIIN
jgi:hypothetical protein